jgi:thiol-disulfide isomerase/thioredoxin
MRRVLVVFTVFILMGVVPSQGADDRQKVPEFPNLSFTQLDGSRQLDLESFRGRPVLMTFWASWCGPCREELPELQKLSVDLVDEEFALITINMDQSPIQGARFLQRYDIDVPVYRMDPRAIQALGVSSLPTNVLLDRQGRPVQIYEGYSPEVPNEIRRLVLAMEGGPGEPGEK